jgi:peptidoglycan-N-acetylglucosamine deacetylase
MMAARAQQLASRIIGGVSRRISGLEFDDLMAAGCGVIRTVDPSRQAVSLTFDDGPSAHSTLRVLDVLEANGASATFFLLGQNARRHPELVRTIAARGHEVGCHGDAHLDFHWAAPRRISNDLRRCKETLEDLTGTAVSSVRAPYGHFRWDVRPVAARLGLSRLVGWSVAPPWNEAAPARIADYVLSRTETGSIVLLHDATGFEATDVGGFSGAVAAALEPILRALQQRGLSVARVDALTAGA